MSDKELKLMDLFKNRNIKIGISLLLIGVLLSFASIYSDVDKYKGPETKMEPSDAEPSLNSLAQRGNTINSTLHLKYDLENYTNSTDDVNDSEKAEVKVSDFNFEYNRTIDIDPNESKTVDIREDIYWIQFNGNEGYVIYQQTIVYSRQPYSLLTIPALFSTIIGVVITVREKGFIRIQMEENKRKEREENKDEDGTDLTKE